jgi:hypothetical protein
MFKKLNKFVEDATIIDGEFNPDPVLTLLLPLMLSVWLLIYFITFPSYAPILLKMPEHMVIFMNGALIVLAPLLAVLSISYISVQLKHNAKIMREKLIKND